MQQALPIPSEDEPSKEGQATPMEVADAPLRADDLRYGYQAVAAICPTILESMLRRAQRKYSSATSWTHASPT